MANGCVYQPKQLVKEVQKNVVKGDMKVTVIEMRRDYVNDERICLISLAFYFLMIYF